MEDNLYIRGMESRYEKYVKECWSWYFFVGPVAFTPCSDLVSDHIIHVDKHTIYT